MNPLIAIGLTHFFLRRVERVFPRMVIGAVPVFAGVLLVVIRKGITALA